MNTDNMYFHNSKYRAQILILGITGDSLVILHMLAWPNCPTELQKESDFQAQLLNWLRKILPNQEKGCLVYNTTFWIKMTRADI